MIDTGGIETNTDDYIKRQMIRQAYIAIDMADVVSWWI